MFFFLSSNLILGTAARSKLNWSLPFSIPEFLCIEETLEAGKLKMAQGRNNVAEASDNRNQHVETQAALPGWNVG